MISQYAISEIDDLVKEGLQPSPADIIRLNALGLKIDHGLDDNPLYIMRRVAFVADVRIAEPTIAHSIYFAELMRFCATEDLVTRTCLWAWLLSLDEPPVSAPGPSGVKAVVSDFIDTHFKRTTFAQLAMAVNFCLYGYDSAALERPARPEIGDPSADQPTADDDAVADAWSFEIGLIHEAEILGLGISLADARKHTRAQLHAIVHRALQQQCRAARGAEGSEGYKRGMKNKYIAEFTATLDEIRSRLVEERNRKNG